MSTLTTPPTHPMHRGDDFAVVFPYRGYINSSPTLNLSQIESFQKTGCLHLRGFYDVATRGKLSAWVDELQRWPETPLAAMQYFETVAGRRQLCRMEYLLEYHQGLSFLLTEPALLHGLSQLLGEPAVLFKEKINFKLPGGQGFAPHQDAPAFATFGQRYHITAMISVDGSDERNGCLEIAQDGGLHTLLSQSPDGSLAAEEAERLTFAPIVTEPGDLLLFDSYVPHRSGPNHSDRPRRALYVTYNGASGGDRRRDYYREKRTHFPPECEREPGRDYSAGARTFNLGNPIRT